MFDRPHLVHRSSGVAALLRAGVPAIFTLLFALVSQAGPVTLPYAENFATSAGAFTASGTAGTSWTVSSGAYRGSITSTGAAGTATVQAAQLGGDPLTRPGF